MIRQYTRGNCDAIKNFQSYIPSFLIHTNKSSKYVLNSTKQFLVKAVFDTNIGGLLKSNNIRI